MEHSQKFLLSRLEELRALLRDIREHSREFAEIEDADTMLCRIEEKAQAGINWIDAIIP